MRYLEDVKSWVSADTLQLVEPLPGSDLAADAIAMRPYYGWHLASSSTLVAIQYLDTFRMVVKTSASFTCTLPWACCEARLRPQHWRAGF